MTTAAADTYLRREQVNWFKEIYPGLDPAEKRLTGNTPKCE